MNNEKPEVTPESVAKFLASQTEELYARQAKRKELPIGQYIQFVVVPASEELKASKNGDLFLKFAVVPLRTPGDGDSAVSMLQTNHTMFPPKPAGEGEEEFNNLYLWEQFFEAVSYQRKDGVPIPARGVYSQHDRTYYVDGVQVPREAFIERNEGHRAQWLRLAVVDLFTHIAGGESPLANLAFFAKCAKDATGQYTNLQTSKKKGGGPIVAELPKGEKYAEF